jgi:hypothetical protein
MKNRAIGPCKLLRDSTYHKVQTSLLLLLIIMYQVNIQEPGFSFFVFSRTQVQVSARRPVILTEFFVNFLSFYTQMTG